LFFIFLQFSFTFCTQNAATRFEVLLLSVLHLTVKNAKHDIPFRYKYPIQWSAVW